MNRTKLHAIECCIKAMNKFKEKAEQANCYSEWSYNSRKHAEYSKMLEDKYGLEVE